MMKIPLLYLLNVTDVKTIKGFEKAEAYSSIDMTIDNVQPFY